MKEEGEAIRGRLGELGGILADSWCGDVAPDREVVSEV